MRGNTLTRILGQPQKPAHTATNAQAPAQATQAAQAIKPAPIAASVPQEQLNKTIPTAGQQAKPAGETSAVAAQQPPTPDVNANQASKTDIPPAPIAASVPKESLNKTIDVVGKPKSHLSYEQMFKLYFKPPLTPEEQAEEEKKQRRQKTIAAIGDGISALANLYYTTQYAPNAFNAQNSASKKTKDRWDKLNKEREDYKKAYLYGWMRARQMDENKDQADKKWDFEIGLKKAKEERDKAEEERAKAKEQRDQEIHNLNLKLKGNQITEAEHKAKIAEVKAKYEPALQRSIIDKNNRAGRNSGKGNSRSSSSSSGSGAKKSEELKRAYQYWESLSDKEKNQYRDRNNRKSSRSITGLIEGGGSPYIKDDDNFIKQVWEERKAYLRTHGRGDEIETGGYNLGFNFNPAKYKRSNKLPPLN